jgi:hypothetical protein
MHRFKNQSRGTNEVYAGKRSDLYRPTSYIKEGLETGGTDSELYSMVGFGIDNIEYMDSMETFIY